jgi:ABC-2 type transport system permease protein
MTNTATLTRREAGYARRVLVRDPQNLFFTVGLPLLYLFIFATIFGSKKVQMPGQPGFIDVATVMTSSVIVIGVVSAAFQNLVITLVQDRENGVLKRLRSTPVPTRVFIGGHVANALMLSALLSVGVAGLGFAVYGVPFPGRRILAAAVTVTLGAIACSAIAFPFTRLVNKSTAATPMAVAVTLTLFFLSGNFFADADMPRAMTIIADLFPVRQLNQSMLTAFNPNNTGWGFSWDRLAVLTLWAAVATALGPRTFRWTPHDKR